MSMFAALPLLLLAVSPLEAADLQPAAVIQQAKDHIAAQQFIAAADELKEAFAAAQALPEAERTPALVAIHFYSAVALTGAKSEAEAKQHLTEFFKLAPAARLTSPEKYDPRFVRLFNEVHRTGDENADFRFERWYPDYESFVAPPARSEDPSAWGSSPALIILGSRQEKQQWATAATVEERVAFIGEFWKRRDPNPETAENEFQATFNRRVAYADKAFESTELRGATSDRGKVFVLLGPPTSMRRRPLTHRDPVVIYDNEAVVNGLLEQWVYSTDRLPIRAKKEMVSYRFVTQKGIGDGVLQQEDPYAFKALMVAMNPNTEKK